MLPEMNFLFRSQIATVFHDWDCYREAVACDIVLLKRFGGKGYNAPKNMTWHLHKAGC